MPLAAPTDSDSAANRLAQIQQRIEAAARACGRDPTTITLLAVSKRHPVTAIRACAAAGQRAFGESYLQEALAKQQQLADLPLQWHFIGPLQSNKSAAIAAHFDWVHSVDRLKIAQRLNDQRPAHRPALNICLQINISGEASKSGVAPDAALPLARQLQQLPHLRLRGLMAIPAPATDPLQQRRPLEQLQQLQQQLQQEGLPLDTLSMGMSADLEAAVAAGSTLLRIGSALFGDRQ